jgi:hypothetical protein
MSNDATVCAFDGIGRYRRFLFVECAKTPSGSSTIKYSRRHDLATISLCQERAALAALLAELDRA